MLRFEPLIGRRFANFQLQRLLGRGGMAEVYYGWDVKLERPVAVKVIDARHNPDPEYAQRFVSEARAMAAWHHPNIIPIYYADDEDGYYYYVMEYIQGTDLERLLERYAELHELVPQADVIRIGRAAADALDYAHRHGVIHRDVKPSNLLASADNRILLSDFGLAMKIQEGSIGTVFGSPQYIAPEQARNSSQAVAQSDLYALGVILYQMLTGRLPFDDPSPTSLALQHLTLEPPPPRQINPSLSPEVENILLNSLRKQPRERYQTGKELMDALEAALNTAAQTAPFLPASPDLAETARQIYPRVSRRSVAEVVADVLEKPSIPAGEARPAAKEKRPRFSPNQISLFGLGCGAIFILGVLAFYFTALALNPDRGAARAAASQTLTESAHPRPPTATASHTASPTRLPTQTQTQPAPTHTPSAGSIPSATHPPDEAPPTAAAQPNQPPPPRPAGDLFVLYYNETSFYMQNLSGKDRSVFPLAFERLDRNDRPENRMEGWYWGNIYSKFRADYCMVLEILTTEDHLSPPECNNHFLVIRTPTSDSELIFWTKEKNYREFRVLWNDEEVGRCKIAEETCEIYLP